MKLYEKKQKISRTLGFARFLLNFFPEIGKKNSVVLYDSRNIFHCCIFIDDQPLVSCLANDAGKYRCSPNDRPGPASPS